MRAILINERQDKPGLIGRPVVTQSGLISALKGTHQAGQRVTLMNMRSIKDKLAKVQLALDGANQNLLEIGNNLETFDTNLEKLKESTSRLGDYWTQFLNQPTVTDFSLIRFLDVGGAMDKSRQDMMGEYVDPYYIEPNLLLPRGGIFTPTPGMDTMINGPMEHYWGYFEPQPWIDRFGVRLPDGGFYATGYPDDPNHGPGSTITELKYPPSGKFFYGPLVQGPYINGYSLLQAVEADAYGACFCPKNTGIRIAGTPYFGANYGWHLNKVARFADEYVPVWVSAPFYPAGNGVAIEGPAGNIPMATFSKRDGHWYYGRCYQSTVHVHFNEALLTPDPDAGNLPMIPNYQKINQSYMALNAIEYIDVDFIDDEQGEDSYLSGDGGVAIRRYIDMLQHRRFYLNTDSGRWVTRNGQGSLVAGQHQTIFPCVGFNVTDVGDSAGHVEDPFDRGWQSLYAVCRDTLPRQRIDTVPKYFVEVSTYRWNGNLLDVPPRKIGGRQIVTTHVLHTSCRFGYSPYYIGPVEAPNIKPTPKGTYDSVQVLGKCSDGSMILITERIRIKYDDTTVNDSSVGLVNYPSAVRTIENVFYGFDPDKVEGDIFDRECIGLLQQVIVTTYDGHQIVYRENAKWQDMFDPFPPYLWEFRTATFDPFYPRY